MRFPGSPTTRRFAATAAIFVGAGLAITWLVIPPAPAPTAADAQPALRIGGRAVPTEGNLVANAVDMVRRYAAGELTIELPNGGKHRIKRGSLGLEIDRARLADFIQEASRPKSALRAAYARSEAGRAGEPLDVPIPVSLDADLAIDMLLDLKSRVDTKATDASVDITTKKVRPERIGIQLDIYETVARIEAALREGRDTVTAKVEEVRPRLFATALEGIEFSHVIGYFETKYSRSARSRDRTYNLALAASKLDGSIIMPGEVFDFNETVGPRDEAHGYRVATVIAQGELVDGLGGGTCQVSGTLHGAAFFAGMEIVSRYPHSRPSSYIKLGLDATVVYPTINYRFRNPFDFAVVLHQTVKDGVVRAEVLGPSRTHTVTFFRRIDEVIPFEETVRETDKLPKGKRVIAQRGIPGFKTTSSRLVRDGAYGRRTKWNDSYPPTPQLIDVGTGPKDMDPKLHEDAHPEYLADEYLVVTQGPSVRTPGVSGPEEGGGTIENRVPGKTGTRSAKSDDDVSESDAPGEQPTKAKAKRSAKKPKR